jgi:hypothetical protein
LGEKLPQVVGVTAEGGPEGQSPYGNPRKRICSSPFGLVYGKRLLFIAAFFVDFYFLVTTCF